MSEPANNNEAKSTSPRIVAGGAAAGVLAALAAVGEILKHDELTVAAEQLLANVAGSLPLLALICWLAWRAMLAWRKAQADRAAEAAAANEALLGVAAGVTGLRGEVQILRTDLRAHADHTEARLRAVEAEVSTVAGRVAALESLPAKRSTAKTAKRN
jgi:hypothetical protein